MGKKRDRQHREAIARAKAHARKKHHKSSSHHSSHNSSHQNSSHGAKSIAGTNKIMTGDAYDAMTKLSPEARNYILKSDFGHRLDSKEVRKLNSRFINANKQNQGGDKNQLLYSNLPDEAFEVNSPALMPGTPEYKKAMDKISTAYFDIIQQQLNATTEQEQEAAQYNWETLKKSMEKTLNTKLSDDAFQAWNQVKSLRNQFSNQGIATSGIQGESIDDYLKSVRRRDENNRTAANNQNYNSQYNYYKKFATPEQIKKLIDTDPEKAKGWGFVPSEQMKHNLSPEVLHEKYPSMSDEDIQRSISSILDANGNYRSSLYQKYMTGNNLGANQGNIDRANIVKDQYGNQIVIPVKPSDSGYQDIQAAKKQYLNLNTPLAAKLKDYNSRVALGQTKPTSGATSGTAAGTQFNSFTDNYDIGKNNDLTNRVNPGSMLSSAS